MLKQFLLFLKIVLIYCNSFSTKDYNRNLRNFEFHEQIITYINSNHSFHNHSKVILDIIQDSNFPKNLEEDINNTKSQFINEEKDYINNQEMKARENFKLVESEFFNKTNSTLTFYKGRFEITRLDDLQFPFLNLTNTGEIILGIEFIELITINQLTFYETLNIFVEFFIKLIPDQILEKNDFFILMEKSTQGKFTFSDIIFNKEEISIEISEYNTVMKKVYLLDFTGQESKFL